MFLLRFQFQEAMKLLSNESGGTYLLRTNEDGELRISYKRGKKVEHIRVFNNDDMFWIQKHEDKKWPSIRRLVEVFVRYIYKPELIVQFFLSLLLGTKSKWSANHYSPLSVTSLDRKRNQVPLEYKLCTYVFTKFHLQTFSVSIPPNIKGRQALKTFIAREESEWD